jgi:uncharacterized membrane protein
MELAIILVIMLVPMALTFALLYYMFGAAKEFLAAEREKRHKQQGQEGKP